MKENDFLLRPLEEAISFFESKGFSVQTIGNNVLQDSDTKLVTNIVIDGDNCKLFFGEYIFNFDKSEST